MVTMKAPTPAPVAAPATPKINPPSYFDYEECLETKCYG